MAERRNRKLAAPFVWVISGLVTACAQGRLPEVYPAATSPTPTLPVAAPAASLATSPGFGASSSDRDGDRIADSADRCPDEPETFNGRDDQDGCPDKGVVITPSDPPPPFIRFEGHAITPTPSSAPILDAVADTLQQHPEVTRVVIEGHEDPSSPADQAARLSQARAQRIRDELVARGVSAARLRPIGLGAYCPLAIAKSIEGRNENRRVSFVVEENRDGPTYAQVGCAAAHEAGLLP